MLVDTAQQGLRLLAAGQHDAMLIGKLAGLQTIRSRRIAGFTALDARVGSWQRFVFTVGKGAVDLPESINAGLALTRTNGVFERLFDRWFGLYDEMPLRLRDVWPIAALFGLVAATAWSISRQESGTADSRLQPAAARRVRQPGDAGNRRGDSDDAAFHGERAVAA